MREVHQLTMLLGVLLHLLPFPWVRRAFLRINGSFIAPVDAADAGY